MANTKAKTEKKSKKTEVDRKINIRRSDLKGKITITILPAKKKKKSKKNKKAE